MHFLKTQYNNITLQKFAWILCGYYLLALIIVFLNHHVIHWTAGIIFSIFFLSSFIMPRLFLPFKITWDAIFSALRYINTHIILCLLFFGIITPIAFIRRCLRKDTLYLKYDSTLRSYRQTGNQYQNDLEKPY